MKEDVTVFRRLATMFRKEPMSINGNFVLRVDFPALTELVAFLKASEQPAIDALTTKVGAATQELKQSSNNLQQAVDGNK